MTPLWAFEQVAWPVAFVAVLWGLGFATAHLGGLRNRLFNAALAVPLTVGAVAISTLVHIVVPQPFGWVTVVVVLGIVGAVLRLVRRGRPRVASRPDGRSVAGLMAMLGVSSACAMLVIFVSSGGSWELVSQTWDAIFDANATRQVYETGLVNPLLISDFAFPQPVHTFYPSTFHALGALYMHLSGADAVVATNVVAAVLAGTLWPSVAVIASWIVLGPRSPRPAIVVLLSGGFWALPWAPLGWGVLWASALAAVFVPIVVAGAVAFVSPNERLGRRAAGALVVGGVALIAALHPRIAAILALLLVGLGCWFVGNQVVNHVRRREWLRALALAGPAILGLLMLAQFLRRFGRTSSQFGVRVWPVERPVALEVLGYLANGPGGSIPQPLTAVAILVGMTVAWRSKRLRALALLAGGAVLLDVLTATLRGVWAFDVIARFWYNDRVRTMAVAAGSLVVVAAVGWQRLSSWWLTRMDARPSPNQRAATYPSVAAAIVLAMGTGCAIPYMSERYIQAASSPTLSLITPEEVAAFRRVAEIVPEGDRILNNANDGSALLYAYVNRKPTLLIAGLAGSTPNSEYLRDQLILLEPSNICKLMRADGIRWIINNGRAYSNGVIDEATSPRLQIPPGFPLTTERMRMGHTVLFELTGCPA